MKLSEFKEHLSNIQSLDFYLPNGSMIPSYFHITEIGIVSKYFMDCGGTTRQEKVISFQLWNGNDKKHRLTPEKLHKIIQLSEKTLGITDGEIEIEYQLDTISRFSVNRSLEGFQMQNKFTDCLASDNCGLPAVENKKSATESMSCTPGGGCC